MKVFHENIGESVKTKHDKDSELLIISLPDPAKSFERQSSKLSSAMKMSSKGSIQTRLAYFVDSKSLAVFMTVVTFYALFGDDVRIAFYPKSKDNIFYSLSTFTMAMFLIELIMFTCFKKNYKWSFYFWLDLLATISLIPDIGWLWDLIIGLSPGESSQSKSLQNAATASRIGTRTSRAIRIIRLLRLIRLVKLYKNAKQLQKKEEDDDEEQYYEEDHTGKEIKVGMKLSDLITKKLISVILIMLLILPIFESSFYLGDYTWSYEIHVLSLFSGTPDFSTVADMFISDLSNTQYPLIHVNYSDSYQNFSWDGSVDYSTLRYQEIYYVSDNNTVAIFDLTVETKLIGVLDICRTIFVIMLLALGIFLFVSDTARHIVNPIKNIIEKVKLISQDLSTLIERKVSKKTTIKPKKKCWETKVEHFHEIMLIEKTFKRIGILLVLVFGEAGTRMIKNYMSLDGDLDLGYTGIKIFAVFCMCDIRNFTEVTEELQENVMIFINEISLIVHSYVHIYNGNPNKNIGDAFLLVWKVSESFTDLSDADMQTNADLAMLCVLKIIANIRKETSLQKYRENSKLQARLKDFDIRLGFGLHMGWAIEGPVGSEYKIDPTYLSPHVNLTFHLEALTKLYGVPIVFTQAFEENLTKCCFKTIRKIDQIILKNQTDVINLYTLDVNPYKIIPLGVKNRERQAIEYKKKMVKKLTKERQGVAYLKCESSSSINAMTQDFSKEFYSLYKLALEFYINGFWVSAKEKLEKILEICHNDGPTLSLLNFMKENNCIAPADWKGFRRINHV